MVPADVTRQSGVARARLDSIDLLRGLVMVVMVLDHTRDYVYVGSFGLDPTNMATTTVPLFFTRWITHFCAPVFVFLAGVSAYLQTMRGKKVGELSRFLVARGVWLVALEFTVVRVGALFNLDYTFLGVVQVIWVIGVSMIVLAVLVHLPVRVVGAFGVILVAGHNLLDGIHVQGWQGPGSPLPDAWAKLWIVLHQTGELFPLYGDSGPVVAVIYPLVPWIGVMAAGYAFGAVFAFDSARRRDLLYTWGGGLTLAFLVLRAANVYGDPRPWASQPTLIFTVLSFLNLTKYPVSLLYLLMTIGPSLAALGWAEGRERGRVGRALVMFGRVPLFFYLLQWPAAHLVALSLSYAVGQPTGQFFLNPPALFAPVPGAGFGLPVVYACWAVAIVALFPLCAWFAGVKQRRRDPWLSYL